MTYLFWIGRCSSSVAMVPSGTLLVGARDMLSLGQNQLEIVESVYPFGGAFKQNAAGRLCLFGRHVRCTQGLLAEAKTRKSREESFRGHPAKTLQGRDRHRTPNTSSPFHGSSYPRHRDGITLGGSGEGSRKRQDQPPKSSRKLPLGFRWRRPGTRRRCRP